jgi:hypothetical protein
MMKIENHYIKKNQMISYGIKEIFI